MGQTRSSDDVSDMSAFPGSRLNSDIAKSRSPAWDRRFRHTEARIGPKLFLLNTTATTSTASAGLIRRLEIASAKHGCQDGRSAGGPFWRAASHPVHRERYEMCSPAHRGRLIVAPLWPRAVQARLVRANAAKADYRFGAKSRPRWYRASCSDRQEETSGVLLIERAPDPETDDAVPTAGCSTATISRADLIFKAGPGTAAEAMVAAIAGHPWRSVDRCAPIILV